MKIVEPLPLTVLSTTAPADDAALFNPGAFYDAGSRSIFGDSVYEKNDNTAAVDPFSANVYYPKGSVRTYSAQTYAAQEDIVFQSPDIDTANWVTTIHRGRYETMSYNLGDVVDLYVPDWGGSRFIGTFISLVGSNMTYPTSDPLKWRRVQPTWVNTLFYVSGDGAYFNAQWYRAINNLVNPVPDSDSRWTISTTSNPDASASWTFISKSNPNRCVDERPSSYTIAQSPTYVIRAEGIVNTVGIVGVKTGTIILSVYLAGQLKHTETKIMTKSASRSWWGFYFQRIEEIQKTTFNIPECLNPVIVLEFLGKSTIGHIVSGRAIDTGATVWGASGGIMDWSIKDVDQFGLPYLKEGLWSDRDSISVDIDTSKKAFVRRLLARFRATPALWIGNDIEEHDIITFAKYNDFSLILEGPVKSRYSIELEGLN